MKWFASLLEPKENKKKSKHAGQFSIDYCRRRKV
jgi:hypothetical protein